MKTRRRLWAVLGVTWLMIGCMGSPVTPESTPRPDPTATPEPTPSAMPSPLPTPSPVPVEAALDFSGEQAMEYVRAQMAFGPRPTGSEAARQTGEYILAQLEEAGWQTDTQPFEYHGVEARNLIGRRGTGGRVWLIGAHYDTRRRADQDADDPGAPVPGANDGASGVAVLLELANALSWNKMNGEVWLVFFDAEDNGQLDDWEWIVGSCHFAENLTTLPEYMILVDMVGDADQTIYYDGNSDPALREAIWETAAGLGYDDSFISSVGYQMLDDHIPFVERGVPSVDIIDFDYPYWHTTSDTIDKVSPASLERVGRTLELFVEQAEYAPGADD
jgi:glutaminyl-peptide cyclotransferase